MPRRLEWLPLELQNEKTRARPFLPVSGAGVARGSTPNPAPASAIFCPERDGKGF